MSGETENVWRKNLGARVLWRRLFDIDGIREGRIMEVSPSGQRVKIASNILSAWIDAETLVLVEVLT